MASVYGRWAGCAHGVSKIYTEPLVLGQIPRKVIVIGGMAPDNGRGQSQMASLHGAAGCSVQ